MPTRADLLGFGGPDLAAAALIAESLMVEEIVVSRLVGGNRAGVLDAETGEVSREVSIVAGAASLGNADRSLAGATGLGMMALIRRAVSVRAEERSEEWTDAARSQWVVSMPWDAPEIQLGDRVKKVSPDGPEVWIVDGLIDQAMRVRRRASLHLVTPTSL